MTKLAMNKVLVKTKTKSSFVSIAILNLYFIGFSIFKVKLLASVIYTFQKQKNSCTLYCTMNQICNQQSFQ